MRICKYPQDRIRLIAQTKASKAKAMLAFVFEPSKQYEQGDYAQIPQTRLSAGLWFCATIGLMRIAAAFDSVSRWSLIALCFLLPFFFVPLPWVTLAQSKMLVAALTLGIAAFFYVLARLADGTMRIPASIVLGAGILLPLAYAVSSAVAGFQSVSLVGSGVESDTLTFTMLAYAALAVPALVFTNGGRLLSCTHALLSGAGVLSLLQLLHVAVPSLPLSTIFSIPSANAFGNWHQFAIMSGLILLLSLISIDRDARMWRYIAAVIAILALVILALINSFDVWIGVGCVALIAVLWHLASGAAPIATHGRTYAMWAALVVISAMFALFGTSIGNALPAWLQFGGVEVRPSWQGTFAIQREVLSHPSALIFGAGPNTFTRMWRLYKPVGVNETVFWNSDFQTGVGFIPTSFVTLGAIGVLAWALFLLALLWQLLRIYRSPHFDPLAVMLGLATVYTIAFHILYAPGPALGILTFTLIGLLIARGVHTGTIRVFHPTLYGGGLSGKVAVIAGVLLGFIFVAASGGAVRAMAADALVNRSIIDYNAGGDAVHASQYVTSALRIYPSDRAHRAAVELGLLELAALAGKGGAAQPQLEATIRDTIEHGLSAVSIDGADYQNWLELAGLYQQLAGAEIKGAAENARAALLRAEERDPKNPLPYYNAARLDLLEGKTDGALANLLKAAQLKTNFADAFYLASQIYVAKSDFPNAIATAQLTVQAAPDDAGAWYNFGVILYGAKDYENAAIALEQAVTRNQQYANALYVLGLSYDRLNRQADAVAAFEALQKLAPDAETVPGILSNLRAGKPALPVSSTTTPAVKR